MELALNLAWLMLAVYMVWAWLRYGPRDGAGRRTQLIALAVVILILLPAISMTDDLLAAQRPAVVEYCVRRVHERVSPHSMIPVAPALPTPAFAGVFFTVLRVAAPGNLPIPLVKDAALAAIQNRPPPAA